MTEPLAGALASPPYSPETYPPGSFNRENHFYPKVQNAHIHPLVRFFLGLGNERLTQRYCHLHPEVYEPAVTELLSKRPAHFRWGGADLFHVTTENGVRRIVVIETNSSPSGQKSMPPVNEDDELAGYGLLLRRTLIPMLKRRSLPKGELAVLFDKNHMEASGYAAALAELTNESVHLIPFFKDDPDPPARFTEDTTLEVRVEDEWVPIRAAVRYVTQKPWTRIPPTTRTALLNPVLVCLAGGRNKMLAAKAYEFLNGELYKTGLRIRSPETIRDVSKAEVPLWIARMGGFGVVKVPYSNAGQGVFTITSPEELDAFMEQEFDYDRFIVQSLIGNSTWSSRSVAGRFYHVGTMPDRKNQFYAADLRFMVGASPEGFFPVAIYARRARTPLSPTLVAGADSWDMLGTNLSVNLGDGRWDTESERLLQMDSRDFNRLGLGLDDLTEAYIQTVLAVSAIDRMASSLLTAKGKFRKRFFKSVNPDPALINEIIA